jgi:membrane protease YdiL (CAAX protease family)
MAAFNGVLVLAVFIAVIKTHERGQALWRPKLYGGMVFESLLYCIGLLLLMGLIPSLVRGAAALAPALQAASAPAADPMADPVMGTVLSLGAGVYEEILFRLVLLSGFAWLLTSGFGVEKGGAESIALVVSAVLFSVFHHLGSMGDPWVWSIVVVRTVAGVFLGAIYLQRGLGIAIWAHALYDLVIVALHSHSG